MTLFSTFLCAMILATCLAACLIEQPSINLLNIYINNNNGNNNYDDVVVQNMQFATLSYIICYFVKANAFFAGNGTIKISLFEFFSFFVFELFVVCVLMETCYIDNSRLTEMVQRTRGVVCMRAFV